MKDKAHRFYCWLWHGVILNIHYLCAIRKGIYFEKCDKCHYIFTRKDWP